MVYADDVSAVLLPPGSRRLSGRCPRPTTSSATIRSGSSRAGTSCSRRGRSPTRARVTERALALDSLLARGYGQLADTYAAERDLPGIAASIERGIDVEPRFTPTLRQSEASAYQTAGAPELALAALEDGVPARPVLAPRERAPEPRRAARRASPVVDFAPRGRTLASPWHSL